MHSIFEKCVCQGWIVAIINLAVRFGRKFCFLLLASPLWFFSLSVRDDADDFDWLSVIVVLTDCMGYQQQQMPFDHTGGLSAIFPILDAILFGKAEWISKGRG
ncbi:hypothetical protein WKW50_24540 [Ochrobactrum sp. GPK 3]|uniref:hypothetical protein n=1 Tax=Brucella sp. 22210 TaxID=3453892 RepID=UPI0031385F74